MSLRCNLFGHQRCGWPECPDHCINCEAALTFLPGPGQNYWYWDAKEKEPRCIVWHSDAIDQTNYAAGNVFRESSKAKLWHERQQKVEKAK